MGKKWYKRWNLHAYREYTSKRYWTLYVIPALEITWINNNRSLHFDLKIFFWSVKLNTFWKDAPEPDQLLYGEHLYGEE